MYTTSRRHKQAAGGYNHTGKGEKVNRYAGDLGELGKEQNQINKKERFKR